VKLGDCKKLVSDYESEEVDFRIIAGDDVKLTYNISTGTDAKDEP
jgi:hypothetical protein